MRKSRNKSERSSSRTNYRCVNARLVRLFNCGDSGLFEVGSRKLKLFIPDFSSNGFMRSWGAHQGKDWEGKEFEGRIKLLAGSPIKRQVSTKSVESVDNTIVARASGVVTAIRDGMVELDCGFTVYFELDVFHKLKPKVGDNFEVKGRIDLTDVELKRKID